MTRRSLYTALVLAGAFVAPLSAYAATTGQNGTHDPSRIIESDGKFYFCGTGGGCASSTDGLAWKSTGLRIQIPSWASQYVNSNGETQGVWAPDIVFYNNEYYIYYSFCGSPATHAPCVIGLLTTPTLDSTSAKYKLTDAGKVVNNPPNTTGYQYSTIDPGPIVDASGNLWSSWGSGYGKDTSKFQIYVTHMDTNGLPLASDPGYQPPMTLGYGLETGGIEGSYVHYHDGYYYLFWNSGGCCSGAASTYEIHVARSATISGPYTGEKVWYASNGSIHGPGHMGVYSACGIERFTYHYYPDTGGSVLGENELSWGSDGWPVAGPPSTTPLKPCGNPTNPTGGTGGSSNAGGSGGQSAGGAGDVGGDASSNGGDSTMTNGGSSELAGNSGIAGGSANGGSAASGTAGNVGASTGGGNGAGAPSQSSAGSTSEPTDPNGDAGCSCSVLGATKRGKQYASLVLAAMMVSSFLGRRRKSDPRS